MAENDEPTQLWSDGTPEAPVAPAPLAAAPQTAPPLPPARRPGPPIWLIAGAAIVLVIVIGVGGIFIGRLMGSPKVTTAPTAAATAPAQSDSAPLAAASAAAPPAPDPSAVALNAGSSVSATVQDAANQFGLIGVWAANCTQPVSNDNYYQTWAATADGAVTVSVNTGPGNSPELDRFDAGHLIGSDQIELDGDLQIVFQKDADGRLHGLQATIGGTQQVMKASSGLSKCSGG